MSERILTDDGQGTLLTPTMLRRSSGSNPPVFWRLHATGAYGW